MQNWFVAVAGKQLGPWATDEVVRRIQSGEIPRDAHVFTQGMAGWEPVAGRPEFSQAFSMPPAAAAPPAASYAPAPASYAPQGGDRVAHEIDYEIFGEEMQLVEITLDPQEVCIAEAGSFLYMEPGIQMETIFGDGSKQQSSGVMGKLLSAGKRVITGESLFMTAFANTASARQKVAFAAPYPGRIIPMQLSELGGTMICQKDSFLVAAKGISLGIAFQRKLGVGFFGGEGFILQKLEGDGLAFVHASGTIMERELKPGEALRIDTGCLVAFEPRVSYDIQFVGGVKTALFGGEGLFFATLTGPGRVWIQSLPFSRFASRIFASAPQRGGSKGEGSLLGGIGNAIMGGDS
ncbi:MAG: TIGR00266 family protein [Thermoanaerobaculia bacterium]|nr:TIGR00266 family protein [Thermoanaerobaculia bacterium]